MNAVLILNQTARDANRKLRQGLMSAEETIGIIGKIKSKKIQYISEARSALPKKFVYDLPIDKEKAGDASSCSSTSSSQESELL